MSRKRTIVNVVCSMISFLCSILISFWLSPFIVEKLGVEANGFVTLANNFISYAALIVSALNAMAARFITIAYVNKDYKKANLYYNSVFWGNLLIVAALLIPATALVVNLETAIEVSSGIVVDIKILFALVFLNFFIQTGLPNWDCGTYVSNRLDRAYIPSTIFAVLRSVILVLMFTLLTPHVWYVALASIIVMLLGCIVGWYNTRKLTPELKIYLHPRKAVCSWTAIKDLVGAGIWDSISSVGRMLLSGLDLIICNLFISPVAMGVLSISKTVPHLLQQLSAAICNAFAPELVINYAVGEKKKMLADIKSSMKLTSIILGIPLVGIIVMGTDFYRLWMPNQDANVLSILTIATCAGYAATSGTQILYKVFSTVNKVKLNAVLLMLSGAVSTAVVFVLLKTTDLGIYAIAGTSTVVNFVRNMVYTVPFAAKYLGYKKTEFFPQVLLSLVSTAVLAVIGFGVKGFFTIENWFEFFAVAALLAVVFLIVNVVIFLNKRERKLLLSKVKSFIKIK